MIISILDLDHLGGAHPPGSRAWFFLSGTWKEGEKGDGLKEGIEGVDSRSQLLLLRDQSYKIITIIDCTLHTVHRYNLIFFILGIFLIKYVFHNTFEITVCLFSP